MEDESPRGFELQMVPCTKNYPQDTVRGNIVRDMDLVLYGMYYCKASLSAAVGQMQE